MKWISSLSRPILDDKVPIDNFSRFFNFLNLNILVRNEI